MLRITHLVAAISLFIACATTSAMAQEATIRRVLPERFPGIPGISSVRATEIPGLFEVLLEDTNILYSDAGGEHIVQGSMMRTLDKANLTEMRLTKLTAVEFKDLPFNDSFKIVRGNGKRQIAVFEDPNCGYCKRFEQDLQKVDDVTVHLFLYPILGVDSLAKSKAVLCTKEPAKAWLDLMLRGVPAPAAGCSSTSIDRNVVFGRKIRISGTPTIVFEDGQRVGGALSVQQIEEKFRSIKSAAVQPADGGGPNR